MKNLKQIWLMMSVLIITARSFGQTFVLPAFQLQMNQCFTDTSSTPNGYTLDSVHSVTVPSHGTLTNTPGIFTYCPDSNFVGTDSATVYACVYGNGTFLGCGNFVLVFNVQNTCTLSVSLYQDSTICVNNNRHYTAVVSGGNGLYSYLWADNSTGTGACELNPGQGTCVTVTDGNGCMGTGCAGNNGCQLAATIDYIVSATPMLYANVTGGTSPYHYYWSTGDTTSYTTNVTAGTYYVSVIDANGCVGSATYIVNGTGNCYFTYSSNGNPQLYTQVSFIPYYDSTYAANYFVWDFNDGTQQTGANPVHAFSTGGYYYVTMNVYYTNGDSCSYSQYVYVQDSLNNYPGCQAYFYWYIDSVNSNSFQFVDYSTYTPASWSWDFGDGTSSTLQNPTHVYNSIGTWNVCLTTTDANGCSSSYCQQISNVPVQDLEAYLFHMTTVTPGFPVWVYLGYYNAGTVMVSGTVTYRYPVGTTVNATSVAPSAHDVAHRLLTFNAGNILPGTSDYISIDLHADSTLALSSIAEDTMWIDPIAGDATPANNISFINDSVVGSWDPNDKAVSPKGEGVHGIVPVSTNEVSYRIRFQNTGSSPAQTVQIRDAISTNIDLTSVRVTDASHAHTTEIIGNQLVVTFANINLPDSGTSHTASQGFIYIHAKLKPGLSTGTQIFNTANIYFDFNLPVVTNTVVTTLGSFISGIAPVAQFDFAIMPNPANNQISLRGEFERDAAYEILDQLGQTVLKGEVNSNTETVNISGLSTGVYLVKITSGQKFGIQRMVVAK